MRPRINHHPLTRVAIALASWLLAHGLILWWRFAP